jgi:hypothetical protein
MEMSNSGRKPKVASSRLLNDGSMSAKKEMGEGAGIAALSSRNLLRRYLHADLGSDLPCPPVAVGEIDPQMGFVFRRPISPVQDFRFQNSTADGSGFLPPETPNRTTITTPSSGERRVSVGRERENMLRRLREAGDSMGMNQPGTDEFGSGPACPSGDFRYLPTLHNPRQPAVDAYNRTPQLQAQVGPVDRSYERVLDDSSGVPERFHQGQRVETTESAIVRSGLSP